MRDTINSFGPIVLACISFMPRSDRRTHHHVTDKIITDHIVQSSAFVDLSFHFWPYR